MKSSCIHRNENGGKEMKKLETKPMVVAAMLGAISVLLDYTGIGTIKLPIVSFTVAHIPTIIGSIVMGPVVGSIVGLFFGLSSLIRNLTQPTSLLSFAFMNPIISVLPRIIVGIVPYYVYHLSRKKLPKTISIGISSILGSAANTVGVLGLMYVIYAKAILEKLQANESLVDNTAAFLWGIVLSNGIFEMIISGIIATAIVIALFSVYKTDVRS